MNYIKNGQVFLYLSALYYLGYNLILFDSDDIQMKLIASDIFYFAIIIGLGLYLNPLFKMYTKKVQDEEDKVN